VNTPWGPAGLSICYDIRFPELFLSYALEGAKLVFSPAAFPHPKLHHWKALVRARAIENQMFMIAANQVGGEDLGADGTLTYVGNSAVIDPWGETVIEGPEDKEELLTGEIDISRVDEIRNKMKVFRDRRPDVYRLG
jgi:predicted amidohydrolase